MTAGSRRGQDRSVPIKFFDLLADDGWAPLQMDQTNPAFSWSEGGSLADAPVDVKATFDGAMWYSTLVERAFNITGLRCRAGFTVPQHHHNRRMLVIVFGGELVIEHYAGERGQVGPAQLCGGEP